MRFGGKMNNTIELFLFEEFQHCIAVGNIAPDKTVVAPIFNVPEIFQIAGVGEFVQIRDSVISIGVHKMPDNV